MTLTSEDPRGSERVIFNSLASLKRMLPPSEDGRMLLEIVGEEADRLNRMVSDLLDFARPNEAQLRPESLRHAAGHADDGRSLARCDHETQIFEDGLVRLVAEPDIAKLDVAFERLRRTSPWQIAHLTLDAEDVGDALEPHCRL